MAYSYSSGTSRAMTPPTPSSNPLVSDVTQKVYQVAGEELVVAILAVLRHGPCLCRGGHRSVR